VLSNADFFEISALYLAFALINLLLALY